MADDWHKALYPVYGDNRQLVAEGIGAHFIARGVDLELAMALLEAWNSYACPPWLRTCDLQKALSGDHG